MTEKAREIVLWSSACTGVVLFGTIFLFWYLFEMKVAHDIRVVSSALFARSLLDAQYARHGAYPPTGAFHYAGVSYQPLVGRGAPCLSKTACPSYALPVQLTSGVFAPQPGTYRLTPAGIIR